MSSKEYVRTGPQRAARRHMSTAGEVEKRTTPPPDLRRGIVFLGFQSALAIYRDRTLAMTDTKDGQEAAEKAKGW